MARAPGAGKTSECRSGAVQRVCPTQSPATDYRIKSAGQPSTRPIWSNIAVAVDH